MVEFAGGKWQGVVKEPPQSRTSSPNKTLVLSCKEDAETLLTAPPAKAACTKRGKKRASSSSSAQVYETELLLSGLLKKKLDFKAHALQI